MYHLPHKLNRPYQAEVLEWILESNKKYLILCAPTGFGKSPLPAATSIDFRTLVLVLHKSLQSANYRDIYNFDILYGKSNYLCNKPKKQINLPGFSNIKYTAYDCGNHDCLCPYQEQVLKCLDSNRVSLNYAKFLSSKPFTHSYRPELLFLDEAHNLPEIITEFSGITLDYDNEFLQCNGNIYRPGNKRLNHYESMFTFRQLARACQKNKPQQSKDLVKWRKWKRLSTKIQITNEVLSKSNEDWYFESTDQSLLIKPLTARHHFKRFFDVADKIILMSATIKPSIAERLGIDEDEYDFKEIPSNWPIPTRFVYDMLAPNINYSSSNKDKDKQVKLIASVLNENNSGIIHTMSKAQSFDLKERLKRKRKDLQFYVPNASNTEEQLNQWYQISEPGTYCISWSFHEGVDLGCNNINIMAKTPYASLSGNYNQAKKEYDLSWYLEKTAYRMEQIFGRHQRGIIAHYSRQKNAFIADGSWHRLKSYLSKDFNKRVMNWKGR